MLNLHSGKVNGRLWLVSLSSLFLVLFHITIVSFHTHHSLYTTVLIK